MKRTLIRTEDQYIMLDADGYPVEKGHQDDESDICCSSTISGLLDIVADRVGDMATDDFIDEMADEYEGWRVAHQTVTTCELLPAETAQIAKIRADYAEKYRE